MMMCSFFKMVITVLSLTSTLVPNWLASPWKSICRSSSPLQSNISNSSKQTGLDFSMGTVNDKS